MDRRGFLQRASLGALAGAFAQTMFASAQGGGAGASPKRKKTRPNILFCIADDQSWAHTSIMNDPVVKTPAFDRVAREGVLFRHAYCCAPSCSPSRSSILTGQAPWRLEEGGDLWGTLPSKFPVYPDLLEAAGYHVGYMRKGWGPGRDEPGGRKRNPAGNRYKNFEEFLNSVPEGKPFCFWFGSYDPHRPYKKGSGRAAGMDPSKVIVPPHLPDAPEVRSDILDYYLDVQRYDSDVGAMLKLLEQRGLLDNTLVVVTSDNGMAFPRAKANLYDFGTRMPLAVRWPERVPGGRVVDDFISFEDFAPTFLEAAGLEPLPEMTGKSFLNILTSNSSGRTDPERNKVFFGRERHAWCRAGGLGYPSRAVRTHEFLYIRNFAPERWPAGDPQPIGRWARGFGDCDDSPTKFYMLDHREDEAVRELFALAFDKRPAEELYHLRNDPGQLRNVADKPEYAEVKQRLARELERWMAEIKDARALGRGELWDSYPYYGGHRQRK